MRLQAPPLAASLWLLVGIAILCSLGIWQLKRLAWKAEIIAQLDTAYAQPPEQSPDFTKPFDYGQVSGMLLPAKALTIGPRTQDGAIGHHVLVPLHMQQAGIVMLNLGWSDQPLEALALPESASATVTGLTRQPSWNRFTPENIPKQGIWYRADLEEMAEALGLTNIQPALMYADMVTGAALPVGLPNNPRWNPPNKHAQYATFWFTMALALMGVFALRFCVGPKR